ncbi:MAG TPA: VanW family protein [Gaiellaceae bacterium]|nr:VanW family protein [Gaiellaceae bacterium]
MRAEAGARPARRGRPARLRRGRARLVRRAARWAAWAVAAAFLLLLVVGFAYAGSAGTIAGGVTVAGVDLAGLTGAEAEDELEKRARRLENVPVAFMGGGERFQLRPDTLDVEANWSAAVDEAVDESGGLLPVRGLKRLWLRATGTDIEPTVDVYDAALAYRLTEMATAVDRPALDASVTLHGLEPEIVAGRAGQRLDREASAALVVRALAGFERAEVALPVAREEPKVTRETLVPVAERVRTILSAPVSLAFSGASFTLRPRETARLLELPADGRAGLAVKERATARRFENVARGVARKPRSADFEVAANGRVRIVPSRPGRELDLAATGQALLAAASRPTNRTGDLVVTPVQPRLTTSEARALGVKRELAAYSTLYSGTSDRITNLQLGVELLDGARIAPGAVWSFNDHVGPRTTERGFRPAPIILNGEYEEGVGGGVSQVATTVFNAAWEAGIKIAERTAHALYISRYPTGRDATVNYPDVDLKLRNDTGRWLVLKASYDESGILVRLLGGGERRRVESIAGPLEATGPPRVERVPDPTLFEGERMVVEDGEPARAVTVERIVYRGDEVLYREAWTTRYRDEKRVVHVGTKPKPVEPPPPEEDRKPKDEEEPQPPGGGGGGGGSGDGGGGGSGRR